MGNCLNIDTVVPELLPQQGAQQAMITMSVNFTDIVVQMGYDVGGNFNIHIWRAPVISSLRIGEQVFLC